MNKKADLVNQHDFHLEQKPITSLNILQFKTINQKRNLSGSFL